MPATDAVGPSWVDPAWVDHTEDTYTVLEQVPLPEDLQAEDGPATITMAYEL